MWIVESSWAATTPERGAGNEVFDIPVLRAKTAWRRVHIIVRSPQVVGFSMHQLTMRSPSGIEVVGFSTQLAYSLI